MVKVISKTNPNHIIEVPENHYHEVLVRSGTWELYTKENTKEEKAVFVPKEAAPFVDEPAVVQKRKAGRPKKVNTKEE